MDARSALRKAVDIAGGQSSLARALKVRQGNIWSWLNRSKRIPAEYVIPVEKVVDGKVTRHQLRPDIYPPERQAAA